MGGSREAFSTSPELTTNGMLRKAWRFVEGDGIYKGETLVDTYTTDKNGQFVTKEYICDNDWTVREITPSEGYLLDTTVHKVGAEPQLYTVEHNQTANDVTEQVAKGNVAIKMCIRDRNKAQAIRESRVKPVCVSAGKNTHSKRDSRDIWAVSYTHLVSA